MLRSEANAEAAHWKNRKFDYLPFNLTLIFLRKLAIAFLKHITELPWIMIANLLRNFVNEHICLQEQPDCVFHPDVRDVLLKILMRVLLKEAAKIIRIHKHLGSHAFQCNIFAIVLLNVFLNDLHLLRFSAAAYRAYLLQYVHYSNRYEISQIRKLVKLMHPLQPVFPLLRRHLQINPDSRHFLHQVHQHGVCD